MDTSMYADELIKHAIKQRVSDIFILPTTDGYTIKFKTLVGLQVVKNISANKGVEVINHFKFIAEMDIAEHRRPQVGSFIKENNGKNVFLRFSSVGAVSYTHLTLPTITVRCRSRWSPYH